MIRVNLNGIGELDFPAGVSSAVLSAPGVTTINLGTMGASGPSHAAGLVPDPGSTAGATRFLREDATWQVPGGGGGSSSKPVETPQDVPPTTPGTLDDEFTTSTLNSKWTTSVIQTSGAFTPFNNQYLMGVQGFVTADIVSAIYQPAPVPPYEVQSACYLLGTNSSFMYGGIALRDSGTGKFMRFGVVNGWSVAAAEHNSPTSFSANIGTAFNIGYVTVMWLRLKDDGTNLTFWGSANGGTNWTQVYSGSRTSFLANPNQIGLCAGNNNSGQVTNLRFHWFRRTL